MPCATKATLPSAETSCLFLMLSVPHLLFLLCYSSVSYICECIFHFHHIASALGFSFQFLFFFVCLVFLFVLLFVFWFFFSLFFLFFLLFFSPHSPGCLVPSTATAAADDATHNAPQPQPPSLPPSFSQALLRSPLPTLPCLFSPSCLSYSLLSATLGSSRGIVMPAASTTGFSPIIATPTPVKSDVPLVQDAAGNTSLLSLLVSCAHLLPHSPCLHFFLCTFGSVKKHTSLCVLFNFTQGPVHAYSSCWLTQ